MVDRTFEQVQNSARFFLNTEIMHIRLSFTAIELTSSNRRSLEIFYWHAVVTERGVQSRPWFSTISVRPANVAAQLLISIACVWSTVLLPVCGPVDCWSTAGGLGQDC